MFEPLTWVSRLGAQPWAEVWGTRVMGLRSVAETKKSERLVVRALGSRALRLRLETGELQMPT